MTEPKTKEAKERGDLSQTTISYLQEIFLEEKYKRRNEFSSKYIEKGLAQEEQAITLYTRAKGVYLQKNTTRLYNEFLTGEPDAFIGDQIQGCEKGIDFKCSWSIFTFPFYETELDPQYKWQNTGYLALTGAGEWETSYCLVNATANLVLNEKKAIWYKLGCPDEDSEEYIKKCIEVEKNLIFNRADFRKEDPGFDFHCPVWEFDIPLEERVKSFATIRSEEEIEIVYNKVKRCRAYLNEMAGIKEPQLIEA